MTVDTTASVNQRMLALHSFRLSGMNACTEGDGGMNQMQTETDEVNREGLGSSSAASFLGCPRLISQYLHPISIICVTPYDLPSTAVCPVTSM